uniref:mL121 n=1 Tax=Polytomella magna TaxID=353565 RepID=UPI002240E435|nr:Chain Xb, mL121 [Polytomella magna]8APN_Xb Chain Xb, mL121 [Polytomella magna]8APO_Xb Chain Xb, mL121 [Polytomella magna]
ITTLEFYEQNKEKLSFLVGNDVYSEFEEKWKPKPKVFDPEIPIAEAMWPEGRSEKLQSVIVKKLSFSTESAGSVVAGMKHGYCPDSVDVIVSRVEQLKAFEGYFPGFKTEEFVSVNPRLLNFSTDRIYWAMLTFQDMFSSAEVGPLMANIGHFIIENPIRCAKNLFCLATELESQLSMKLDVTAVKQDSWFTLSSEETIRERVAALATIFGSKTAGDILLRDINYLRLDSKDVNRDAVKIREHF